MSVGQSLGVAEERICQKSCHRIAQGTVWMFVLLFVCYFYCLLLLFCFVLWGNLGVRCCSSYSSSSSSSHSSFSSSSRPEVTLCI